MGEGSYHAPSCDRTTEVMHKLDDIPDASDGDTPSLDESGPDAEQECDCTGESVGTACLCVALCTAWVVLTLVHVTLWLDTKETKIH